MKKPRAVATGTGAVTPREFCHADSNGAGQTGAKSRPFGLDSQSLMVLVPIRTVNGTNAREHWATRARRAQAERKEVFCALFQFNRFPFGEPLKLVRVKLTRLGPNSRAMDSDGLQASMKHVRDQVAQWLGVDDADPRIRWDYWQERGREYAVRIEISHEP